MHFCKWLLLSITLILIMAFMGIGSEMALAQEPGTPPANTEVSKNPQPISSKSLMMQQIKVLSQQQYKESPAKTKTAKTLEDLSRSISNLQFGANQLIVELHRSQVWIDYLKSQLHDPILRKKWSRIFLKGFSVVGLGYLLFILAHHFLRHDYQRLLRARPSRFFYRVSYLVSAWVLLLVPIILFALVSYLTLFFLKPEATTQWVLLAWICAFVIVNLVDSFYSVCLTGIADYPGLKKVLITITALIIYGYFVLQTALYLGIDPPIGDFLAKLLGFLVVIVLVRFVVRGQWHLAKILPAAKIKKMSPERLMHLEMGIRVVGVVYLLLLYLVWLVQSNHYFWFVLKSTFLSLVLIFIAVRSTRFFHSYLTREFTISQTFRKRLPGFEKRIKRYRRILDVTLRFFIYIALASLIIKIWSGGNILWVAPAVKDMIIVKTVVVVFILLTSMLIWEMSNSLIEFSLTKGKDRVAIESGRTHTLLTVARKTIFAALFLIVFLMILSQFGISIAPLLAGVGVVGLAISFGSQKLVQDLITGFFMLLEDQIAVGDVVKIGDNSGTVEAITLRTVRLRDSAGVVHIIPYNTIVTVSNMTKEYSYYLLDLGVDYRENVDEVMAVLGQIAAQLQKDNYFSRLMLEPLETLGVDKFADSAVVIRTRIKTKPGMQWQVGREFNRRIKQKFDELNIQIPFPHSVVFFGNNPPSIDKNLRY